MGVWGLPVLLLVLVTSPFLQQRRRRTLISRYGSDRAEMRREFDEIVAQSFGNDRTES
jgi:cytochrome c-type biogenesis protein CcmH/NrfF